MIVMYSAITGSIMAGLSERRMTKTRLGHTAFSTISFHGQFLLDRALSPEYQSEAVFEERIECFTCMACAWGVPIVSWTDMANELAAGCKGKLVFG
jgi:hypothetical protein